MIDPLDGTKSFVTGKPLFGTLIGLMKSNKPYLGILNQPILKERWVGIANNETRYNNVKVKTRNCKKLKGSRMYATSPMMFTGKNQKVYKSVIPRNVRLSEAPSDGIPILIYDKLCAGSKSYSNFADEFLSQEDMMESAA